MILVINGNICAGKSTVMSLLANKLNWHTFSIDDYRHAFNADNTPQGDRHAVDLLCSDISYFLLGDCILELTTTNKRFNEIVSAYNGFHKIVTLNAPVDKCIERYEQRRSEGYVPAPFPYYKTVGIHTAMHIIDKRISTYPADLEVDNYNNTPAQTCDFIISKLNLK